MSDKNQEIFLKDYKTPYFWIKKVNLDIDIQEDKTFVLSELLIEKNKEHPSDHDLVLTGVDLKLKNIELNNIPLHDDQYEVKEDQLIVKAHEDRFTLTTKVEIDPENNHSGEGLYQSGNIYCTQCEAEGFRKITYYLDRPDVMAAFKTTIKADKEKFPILLSNGNKIDSGDLEDNRHFATWEDPHLKPSYLFATVAGDLAMVADKFKTKSGKNVDLEIYVDKGNEDKCDHAMLSLKNAMKWDEEKFNLEYDLNIYMVVAVDSFNMGAMENKGLNIFNSAYVLANKETATDTDFQGIEGVIGHEYFHNWTGNRVTCRDWFQLTLKEGLTVFRDQEFSSDMLSRPVKRIEDVKRLIDHQFAEDASPMSHPIKPKSYIEINNFYSATVYEKGAEVIRMIHTILGEENFKKGMDLYFKRHDGQAVTTEHFVAAMSDASGIDLEQFKVWYDQNGTPKINITTEYNETKKQFHVDITQEAILNNKEFKALHIPFKIGLIYKDGSEHKLSNDGLVQIKDKKQRITFDDIKEHPIPSWNRDFSCPVHINYEYSTEELIYLMKHDSNEFNRYNSASALYEKEILALVKNAQNSEKLAVDERLVKAFGDILDDNSIDEAFKSYALNLPDQNFINSKLDIYDYDNVALSIKFLKQTLADFYKDKLAQHINSLTDSGDFSVSAKAMGKRALKNTLLSYYAFCGDENEFYTRYDNSTNMTDQLASFKNIIHHGFKDLNKYQDEFYTQWKHEPLVMQKWLGVLASRPGNTTEDILALEKSDIYDSKVPNFIRALYRNYIRNNPVSFNAKDGSGYKLLADKIIEIDKFNPQIASGLAKSLRHMKNLDSNRKRHLKDQLERLQNEELSKDTFEVVNKNLNH